MAEGTFTRPTTSNGTAIAIVVLMHGAAISALALSKMDALPKTLFPPTKVELIKLPPPPPPPKPRDDPEVKQPQHVSRFSPPTPLVPPPPQLDTLQSDPYPPPPPMPPSWSKPAEQTIVPSPPPPSPPKKIESARARANLASYVSDSDYPAAAVRGEEQGTARFRLTVGPDGRVSGCTITGSSGSSSLDAATCRIMKSRARFTPARDSDGKAVGDTVANAIRWVLPD